MAKSTKALAVEADSDKWTLTTKEVAQQLGTSPKVVLENAKKCLPDKKIENGKATHWTETEITQILEQMKSSNPNQHTFTGAVKAVTTELTPALKIKKAMELMQEGYEEELERIKAEKAALQVERDNLAITLDSSKQWASIKRMEALNPSKQFSWRALKRYAQENGYALKEVYDQNYGTVKSYSRAVWEAVYGEQIDEAPWFEDN